MGLAESGPLLFPSLADTYINHPGELSSSRPTGVLEEGALNVQSPDDEMEEHDGMKDAVSFVAS